MSQRYYLRTAGHKYNMGRNKEDSPRQDEEKEIVVAICTPWEDEVKETVVAICPPWDEVE